MQEEIDYEDNQDDSDDQCFYHVVDGSKKEVVGTHHLHKFQPSRQVLLHLVHLGGDGSIYLCGVTTRYLKDKECHTRNTIYFAVIGIRFASQFHFCNVFQPEHRTVFVGAHYNVTELAHFLQTATILHGVLEYVVRVFT